jgi:hypothetical protein
MMVMTQAISFSRVSHLSANGRFAGVSPGSDENDKELRLIERVYN